MQYDYDLAVFVGRFQPFHLGHEKIVKEALKVSKKILILIGSSHEPRTPRNPWLYDEREQMIRTAFSDKDNERIICKPSLDIRYNETLWISQVQKAVYAIEPDEDAAVTLIGQTGIGKGYYTSTFPMWDDVGVETVKGASGTDIRHHLFDGKLVDDLKSCVDERILPTLSAFMASDIGKEVRHEYEIVEKYKKGWEDAPFPPTHVTVDAIVVQSGHILLVERDAYPGKGLWALPGGFIAQDEPLLDATIRKLKEETKLKVPSPVIAGSVRGQKVFDFPFRSVRGRTITHAFHIELRKEDQLPKVKGGGETKRCFWLPLGKLDSRKMFEDHYFIIQNMLGIV